MDSRLSVRRLAVDPARRRCGVDRRARRAARRRRRLRCGRLPAPPTRDRAGGAATTATPAPPTAPTPAGRRSSSGIGEQQRGDVRRQALPRPGHRARRGSSSPYDATRVRVRARARRRSGSREARRAGVEPFITFGHSRVHPEKLPSVGEFRAAFRAFRARYPDVRGLRAVERDQPRQPADVRDRRERAAEYYNVVKARVPEAARVLAGDVLDQPGMTRYVQALPAPPRRASRQIWGLHNYADTNRFRSSGLRDLLRDRRRRRLADRDRRHREVRAQLPARRAARRARDRLRPEARARATSASSACTSTTGPARSPTRRFDSGLIGPDGTARPAYDALRAEPGGLKAGGPHRCGPPVSLGGGSAGHERVLTRAGDEAGHAPAAPGSAAAPRRSSPPGSRAAAGRRCLQAARDEAGTHFSAGFSGWDRLLPAAPGSRSAAGRRGLHHGARDERRQAAQRRVQRRSRPASSRAGTSPGRRRPVDAGRPRLVMNVGRHRGRGRGRAMNAGPCAPEATACAGSPMSSTAAERPGFRWPGRGRKRMAHRAGTARPAAGGRSIGSWIAP